MTFDLIVDGQVNGQFFLRQPAHNIVQHINDLRDIREKETQKMIVDTFIDTIEHTLSSFQSRKELLWWIRSDLNHSFKILEGKVPCYALPLSHVLHTDEGMSGSLRNTVPCIAFEVKKRLSNLNNEFHFDDKALLRALEDSSCQMNVMFRGQGEKEVKSLALVIRQIVYSDEEVCRKAREEILLNDHFHKMVEKVTQWTSGRSGMRSVNAEVSHRIKKTSRKLSVKKREMDILRSNASDKIRVMQRLHQTADNSDNADKMLLSIKETKTALDDEIQNIESEYITLLATQKLKRIDVTKNAIADLLKKYCYSIFDNVVRNGRAYALSMELRRPWDVMFKEFKGQNKTSQEFLVLEDLTKQLERTIELVQLTWNQMDTMCAYDNKPYEHFLEKSSSMISAMC